MDGLNIVIIILLILVIFWVINNWLIKTEILMDIMSDCSKSPDGGTAFAMISSPNIGDKFRDSTQVNPYVIPKDRFDEALTSNFSITVWFYIYLWKQTDKRKNVLFLGQNQNAAYGDHITPISINTMGGELSKFKCVSNDATSNRRNLAIFLDETQNNLYIDILTTENSDLCDETSSQKVYTRYLIKNIDIQKWNCLSISIDTTTLDIYLDGKLLNSFIMNGTYAVTDNNNIKQHIFIGAADSKTVNGTTWDGIVTRVRYTNHSINPEEAYSIYKEGINSSLANSLLNKYGVKVQFLEYNKPKGEFSI